MADIIHLFLLYAYAEVVQSFKQLKSKYFSNRNRNRFSPFPLLFEDTSKRTVHIIHDDMQHTLMIVNTKKVILHFDDVLMLHLCYDVQFPIFILTILNDLFQGIFFLISSIYHLWIKYRVHGILCQMCLSLLSFVSSMGFASLGEKYLGVHFYLVSL